jgi:hypothetical protein
MVGQAAVARQLGDLARARALLDAAGGRYADLDLPAGQARVLAGLAWWALAADQADGATVFTADAAQAAAASGDPATQVLTYTAVAAVKAITDPTRHTPRPSSRSLSGDPRAWCITLGPTSRMSPRSRPASRCPLAERPGPVETAVAMSRLAAFRGSCGATLDEPGLEPLAAINSPCAGWRSSTAGRWPPKHSLVDPVQLPHMHERALSSGVVPVIRTWVITGRFEDRGGVRASLAGAMRGYFRPGGGGTFVPGRWRWQD